MIDVLAFWRSPIRGSARRARVHTRGKPVYIPSGSTLWLYKEKKKAHCSEQLLQLRTTQPSNRKGKVPTTRARTRNLSTRLLLFSTRAIVVKPSFRLAVAVPPFHRFFRLLYGTVNKPSTPTKITDPTHSRSFSSSSLGLFTLSLWMRRSGPPILPTIRRIPMMRSINRICLTVKNDPVSILPAILLCWPCSSSVTIRISSPRLHSAIGGVARSLRSV
jgi:hypothetical protein